MKNTGELLKQKRESIGLSLSEVALATKINPKVLSAIEAGDESNLPAKTILKGFVRSYALFLKMDVDDVVRTFIEETGGPKPSPLHETLQKSDGQTQAGSRRAVNDEASSGLRTAAVVVIALLIGVIIGIRELVDKYQREKVAASTPADVKVSPLAEEPTAAPVTTPASTPAAEVAKTESTKPEVAKTETTKSAEPAAPVETASSEHAPASVTSTADLSSILAIPKIMDIPVEVAKAEPPATDVVKPDDAKPEVAKTEVAKTEVAKTEASATDTNPAEAAKPEEPKPDDVKVAKSLKNEVIIEALDRVDIKFELAGESKSVALAPNEVQVIRAEGSVTMDFSDGGAVSLVHNGRVRGVPGKLGEPKQVKFQ